MKTLYLLFSALIFCMSCGKKTYVYSLQQLDDCLGEIKPMDSVAYSNHNMATFDQGIFVYQNCPGLKEIDGVKVNWLEDESCVEWQNCTDCDSSMTSPVSKINRLTNSLDIKNIDVPQRFFLIFLDHKRVLYFTNHESAKFFKSVIRLLYKNPVPAASVDSMVHAKITEDGRAGILGIGKKKKAKPMEYAFAPLNWNTWGDRYTYNQVIPIQEKGWKKHMNGVYKTYKSKETGFHYLKISFDTGKLKYKKKDEDKVGGGGLIELLFQTDANYKRLKLITMNIPDSSVSLVGENDKGARRRDLRVDQVFALQPVFHFIPEPVKLSITENGKERIIEKILFHQENNGDCHETWTVDGIQISKGGIKSFWHNRHEHR